jgi:hypothetical protein
VGDGWDVGARHVELVYAEQRLFLVGHSAATLALHVGSQEHVGRIGVELERVGNVLAQNGEREGPEALAVLHP